MRLRPCYPGHDRQTVRFAALAGLKNGCLLEAAESGGFDVLDAVDQNMPDQQNLAGRKIALILLCGAKNRLCDLERLVPAALVVLKAIGPSEIVRIR